VQADKVSSKLGPSFQNETCDFGSNKMGPLTGFGTLWDRQATYPRLTKTTLHPKKAGKIISGARHAALIRDFIITFGGGRAVNDIAGSISMEPAVAGRRLSRAQLDVFRFASHGSRFLPRACFT
jgi:hypothetical protein